MVDPDSEEYYSVQEVMLNSDVDPSEAVEQGLKAIVEFASGECPIDKEDWLDMCAKAWDNV